MSSDCARMLLDMPKTNRYGSSRYPSLPEPKTKIGAAAVILLVLVQGAMFLGVIVAGIWMLVR
jgi:hypothetical protein